MAGEEIVCHQLAGLEAGLLQSRKEPFMTARWGEIDSVPSGPGWQLPYKKSGW